jgi:HSP20 family molecular chaperone IbpA
VPNTYEFDFPFFGFWRPFFEEAARGSQYPATGGLDIYETAESVVIEATVPGAKKEEISIEIKDGRLQIDAEHSESEEETKKKTTVYRSQKQSSFHYMAALPKEVEENRAKASLRDGILKITIPLVKKGEKKAKGIRIEEA